jgi:hypothetical protein
MRAWRQTNDQHARRWIAETGHGTAPVLLASIGPALDATDLLTMSNQPRTSKAVDDFLIQDVKRVRGRHYCGRS